MQFKPPRMTFWRTGCSRGCRVNPDTSAAFVTSIILLGHVKKSTLYDYKCPILQPFFDRFVLFFSYPTVYQHHILNVQLNTVSCLALCFQPSVNLLSFSPPMQLLLGWTSHVSDRSISWLSHSAQPTPGPGCCHG